MAPRQGRLLPDAVRHQSRVRGVLVEASPELPILRAAHPPIAAPKGERAGPARCLQQQLCRAVSRCSARWLEPGASGSSRGWGIDGGGARTATIFLQSGYCSQCDALYESLIRDMGTIEAAIASRRRDNAVPVLCNAVALMGERRLHAQQGTLARCDCIARCPCDLMKGLAGTFAVRISGNLAADKRGLGRLATGASPQCMCHSRPPRGLQPLVCVLCGYRISGAIRARTFAVHGAHRQTCIAHGRTLISDTLASPKPLRHRTCTDVSHAHCHSLLHASVLSCVASSKSWRVGIQCLFAANFLRGLGPGRLTIAASRLWCPHDPPRLPAAERRCSAAAGLPGVGVDGKRRADDHALWSGIYHCRRDRTIRPASFAAHWPTADAAA